MENKYQQGKIYMIKSNQTDKVYIGSTIRPLDVRFKSHEDRVGEKSTTSYMILEYDDAYIELIEEYPCETKLELQSREGYYIRLYGDRIVNKKIIGRTDKEYIKYWKNNNKEKVREYNKQWNIDNKQYFEDNRETIREYNKQYYELNRKKQLQKQGEKIQCSICNSTVSRGNISSHKKSKKCKSFLEQPLVNQV